MRQAGAQVGDKKEGAKSAFLDHSHSIVPGGLLVTS